MGGFGYVVKGPPNAAIMSDPASACNVARDDAFAVTIDGGQRPAGAIAPDLPQKVPAYPSHPCRTLQMVWSLGSSFCVLPMHLGEKSFEIPLGQLATLGLVEPDLQLLVKPSLVEFVGPAFFDNEVNLVRLIILDASEAIGMNADGLSLFIGEFGRAHLCIIAGRPREVKPKSRQTCL